MSHFAVVWQTPEDILLLLVQILHQTGSKRSYHTFGLVSRPGDGLMYSSLDDMAMFVLWVKQLQLPKSLF